MTTYTLYVDESGDAGIGKIRGEGNGGACPYMTLGAVLVPDHMRDDLCKTLENIATTFGKEDLHCSNLGHEQKVYFSYAMAKERILLFGMISFKETLKEYKGAIGGDSKLFYNKCAQYLLECVGEFMRTNKIPSEDLSVCFEEGNFDYRKMRGLIAKCQEKPVFPKSKELKFLDVNKITARPKKEEPLLQVADLVAHALFRCVDGKYDVVETRYLEELHKRFYCDVKTKRIEGAGLKSVHLLSKLELVPYVYEVIDGLRGGD